MKFNPLKNIGPGTLIAAAFIGPGTVTLCSKAGVSFGFTLLWTLVLSVIATAVLQEMAARLGLISQKGLAEAVRQQLQVKWIRYTAVALIVASILIGNTAYQAGNISGGALGLEPVFKDTLLRVDQFNFNYLNLIIGVIAFLLLYFGNYKMIELLLVTLVLIMSLSFVIAAVITRPDWSAVFSGLFIPKFPENSLLTVMGLIGTTVVPYNLFLHAALIQEKWQKKSDLKAVRKDTYISVALGGIVSMAIVISAAAMPGETITSAGDLAKGLKPLYGNYATYFLGTGLFAAGITSAITAPLAAAYVAKGCFGWKGNTKSPRFRLVWMMVLIIGTIVSTVGKSPIEIIQFAQVANGLLLPIIALFLFWMVNKAGVMGKYVNTVWQNAIGGLIILMAIGLTVKTLFNVFFT